MKRLDSFIGEAWCLTVQSGGVAGVDDQEVRVMASTQMSVFFFFLFLHLSDVTLQLTTCLPGIIVRWLSKC